MKHHNQYKVTCDWLRCDGKHLKRGNNLFRATLDDQNHTEVLYDSKQEIICFLSSENAHLFTVGNDDGKWAERNDRILHIRAYCEMRKDLLYLLYESRTVAKYNKNKYQPNEPILWNDDFYCAPLSDLDIILSIFELEEVLPSDKTLILL